MSLYTFLDFLHGKAGRIKVFQEAVYEEAARMQKERNSKDKQSTLIDAWCHVAEKVSESLGDPVEFRSPSPKTQAPAPPAPAPSVNWEAREKLNKQAVEEMAFMHRTLARMYKR